MLNLTSTFSKGHFAHGHIYESVFFCAGSAPTPCTLNNMAGLVPKFEAGNLGSRCVRKEEWLGGSFTDMLGSCCIQVIDVHANCLE